MSDNYKDLSVSEIKDLLRQWRENNERRSQDIMQLDIMKNIDNFGNEKHVILEQVIHAAMDAGKHDEACWYIRKLIKEFPGSNRATSYYACSLGALEKYEEANEILNKIISRDETNAPARKRKIALLKGKGQITEAIKELVDYLKKFMSDAEGWQELCELYLQVGDLSRAVFCAEEMLLHQPHNNLWHQRIADIRYTMGGTENVELAKTYYCQALKLNPDNMRALLGLILVANNLLTHHKSSGNSNKRKEVAKLAQWAASTVAQKQKDGRTNICDMTSALTIGE